MLYSQLKFKEYYEKNFINVKDIEYREFGFGDLYEKIKKRHIAFKTNEEFNKFLREIVPMYISKSLSYYEFPSARPMEKKNWLGSDLAFDIDADTSQCDHPKEFVCEKCMEKTKDSVLLVIDILKNDLGFKDIEIVFSGNRGYHIYVYDNRLKELGSRERLEIVKYCIDPDFESILNSKNGGWYLRFKNIVLKNFDFYYDHLISKSSKFKGNKEFAKRKIENDIWDIMFGGLNKWKKTIKKDLSIPDIDANVSTDLSKLLRVPETLHGSSGLCCVKIKDIEKFDPFSDPIVFSEDLVRVDGKIPHFPILGIKLEKKDKLPEYLAIYLELKKYLKIIY